MKRRKIGPKTPFDGSGHIERSPAAKRTRNRADFERRPPWDDDLFLEGTSQTDWSAGAATGDGGSAVQGMRKSLLSLIVEPIPEPSTLALLIVGPLGLLAYARRRRLHVPTKGKNSSLGRQERLR